MSAQPADRPSYVSPDLGGFFCPHAPVTRSGGGWCSDGWTVELRGDSLRVTGRGVDAWWRAVAEAAWDYLDETRRPVDVTGIAPPPKASGRSI